MKHRTLKLFTIFLLLGLGACSTTFKADVVSFHQLSVPQSDQTFMVVPANGMEEPGLEFRQYATLLVEEMQQIGYRQITSGNTADLTIELDYGIDGGTNEVYANPSNFGVYYSFGWGYWRARWPYGWGAYYGWPVYYYPWGYGWGAGYTARPDVRNRTIYKRHVAIRIKSEDGIIYEGRAVSRGTSNDLPAVMPYLIEALFQDFPGPSGRTRTVTIDLDQEN